MIKYDFSSRQTWIPCCNARASLEDTAFGGHNLMCFFGLRQEW